MTPEITTRSFTNDQFVFDNVFFSNCYRLKGVKENGPVIVDIGAHAGFFSFSALTLGASKIYSFEPLIDNMKILLSNTYNRHFLGRVTPYQLGVYTESIIGKFHAPKLIDGIFFDLSSVGLSSGEESNFYSCQCHNLDTILKEYCFDESIDILKINIGYAEREILLNSELLSKNVKAICGEVSCGEQEMVEFKRSMGLRGYVNFFSFSPNQEGRTIFLASVNQLSDHFNI